MLEILLINLKSDLSVEEESFSPLLAVIHSLFLEQPKEFFSTDSFCNIFIIMLQSPREAKHQAITRRERISFYDYERNLILKRRTERDAEKGMTRVLANWVNY